MPDTKQSPQTAAKSRPVWKWVALGVAAVAALVLVAIVVVPRLGSDSSEEPGTAPTSVTIYGTEYTTTQSIEEHNGYVYIYIPVNTETSSVLVEVQNAEDNQKIREFLNQLDTFVPGEHVLELSSSNLHFIIDGIAE